MSATLRSGSRLGPYEVLSPLGGGGMGEVYRARDTRLERSVAIKVLPAEFAQDAQFQMRFEREAKAIAQLSHPNICALYDVGSQDGVQFLVLELLEGESLADRIGRGPLPLADVLRYGIEIAEALDRAHRAHIVHRDLKPGNIVITKSGAKLLDFGLARSSPAVAGVTDVTQQKPLTQEGAIVGTFQYMSPEQLEGAEVDHRSDVFSFGAVLYEMLTGRRAFDGATKTSVIAAIVAGTPRPAQELQPLTPPALEHVIQQCLVKDPDGRWQSAHDIAEELRWIASSAQVAALTQNLSERRRRWIAWALLPLVATITVLATLWLAGRGERTSRTIVSDLRLPTGTRAAINAGLAVSPDGRQLVVALDDMRGNRVLWLRPLDSDSFRQLEGTVDASYPFWSPDSREIGFFAEGKLKILDLTGGRIRAIAKAPGPRGGAWSTDGTIIFAAELEGSLAKVSATGGGATQITRLAPGELGHRWPTFLPDGRRFLYVVMNRPGRAAGVYLGSTDDPGTRSFVVDGQSSVVLARDHLFFAREGELLAQPFDADKAAVTGVAMPVLSGVAISDRLNAVFSVSGDGTFVAQRGSGFIPSELIWVDRSGTNAAAITPRELFFSPRLSHDGTRLAVDRSDPTTGQGDIWVYDLQRGAPTRITFKPENESAPQWTPDDRFVVFHRGGQGDSALEMVAAGGTGQAEILFSSDEEKRVTSISPDGKLVSFDLLTGHALADIWMHPFANKKTAPWLSTPFNERGAEFSPNGQWVAYVSAESGQEEIYVRRFPESDRKWLITTGGGTMPAWRGDGKEIFYIAPDGWMASVSVMDGETLQVASPVRLFDATVRSHPVRQYDVTPDGSRFLLNRVDRSPAAQLTLIMNWRPKNQQ